MGLFDSIFSPNTSDATNAAAFGVAANLGDTQTQNNRVLRNTTDQGNQALQTGAAGATTALNQGYGQAGGALSDYFRKAQNTLGSGVNTAVGTVQGSNANYQPAAAAGGAASGMLSDALGLNGPEGNARAVAAFQASPGYGFQVDQATDAATRAAAATGMAASGNTLNAVARLGQNLANQEYQQHISNLGGVAGQGLQAAQGISGNNQAAGGYQYGGGTTGAQLYGTQGGLFGNLFQNQGQDLARVQTNLGNSLSGNYTNLGSNIAANNTGLTEAADSAWLGAASAQDQANSANNGLLTKALGTLGGALLSPAVGGAGGALSSALFGSGGAGASGTLGSLGGFFSHGFLG